MRNAAKSRRHIPESEPNLDPVATPGRAVEPTSRRQTWLALAGITLLSIPLFFFLLGGWGFFDPDEGRYAEIPREMLERHDLITPTLNYLKYFEKPPLLYWSVAASFKLIGFSEFAGRLVPALAALLGLYAAYALGRRMFGHRVGFLGAVILATSLIWPILARQLVIDMLLSVMLFLTAAFWWLGHTSSGAQQRGYFIGFWISLALAVLTKGPVAVVLVGTPIFLYLWLCGQWPVLSKMQWLMGVPLFLLITAPWFTLVAQRNPEFNHFFWYRQHIGRYLGMDKDREHKQSFSYFFKYMPLMLFPWSAFMPGAVVAGWKKVWPARTEPQRALIYLLLNASFILFFFSGSTSKLLTYVLPAVPFCALLFAAYFDWLWRQRAAAWQKPLLSGVTLLSLILVVAGVGLLLIGPRKLHQMENLSPAVAVAAGVFLLLWTSVLVASALQRNMPALFATVSGGMTLLIVGLMLLLQAIAPNHDCKSLLEYIRPGLRPATKIVMYDSYSQSVNFYTGHRVIVKEPGELKFGMENMPLAEKQVWFLNDMQDLHRLLLSQEPVYCFAKDHQDAQELIKALDGDAQEIIWNKRRAVLGNRAALALTPPEVAGR